MKAKIYRVFFTETRSWDFLLWVEVLAETRDSAVLTATKYVHERYGDDPGFDTNKYVVHFDEYVAPCTINSGVEN